MFCKICNKTIDGNSVFCAKCKQKHKKAVAKHNLNHLAAATQQFIAIFDAPPPSASTAAKTAPKKRARFFGAKK